MEIGMTLPTMIAGVDRATTLEWCRRVDDGPWSTLAIGERIAYPNQELWVTLSAAAALTERPRIMATVVVLPMHSAVDIAKKAATLDVLSDGRFVLGVGVGGRDEDYLSLERPFDRRHQRMDDQVALMRRVWAGEPPFDDVHPVGPPPVQPGGPSLYSGALGPRSIARSASWATGVSGFLLDPLGEDAAGTFRSIERAWADAGRTEPPRHVTSFWYALGPDGPARLRAYAEGYLGVFGDEIADAMAASCSASSPGALREAVARITEAGCDELLLVPTTADPAELDRTLDALA
jgi:alkanesulfonate monooxygenase SsuD/methylene tetrahydromethanopterin reductase-like flavin-dependent oxidoreductase (luciferase family)